MRVSTHHFKRDIIKGPAEFASVCPGKPMKLRSALLLLALGAVAACTWGGGLVSLDSVQGTRLGQGGSSGSDGNTAIGGAATNAGTSSIAGLNIGDASLLDAQCAPGTTTSISGTVYDPRGQNPLYNAVVYVPDGALPPFNDKVACESCTDSVSATAVTLSGADGTFKLTGVPARKIVPLVVQLGKWRRQTQIPITPCTNTPLTDHELTRLPKSQDDGPSAHIPRIALSTGHSDALECLLRKIGVADKEFTTDAKPGRVNMFVGCVDDNGDKFGANKFAASLGGDAFPSTNQLFDSGELNSYDMVIFSCEGHKCDTIQTAPNRQKLVDFADAGGRVYLDHDHYNWLNHAGDNLPSTSPGRAIEAAAQFDNNTSVTIPDPLRTRINTTKGIAAPGTSAGFPKGEAFAQWLKNVGASSTVGTLDIHTARTSVLSLSPNRAQSWIYRENPVPDGGAADPLNGFFYFTIGTPVAVQDSDPPPEACGRVVFTDLHVSASDGSSATDGGLSNDFSDQDTPFPQGCVSPEMSAQEKALEFMIFDLSSCVQQETAMPEAPPIK